MIGGGHRRGWRWAAGVLAAAVAGAACQERLTAPAECPELCPGGEVQIYDTIVPADAGRDSSFTGYVDRGKGIALLVANGSPSQERAVYRFLPRNDSVAIRDTLRAYTVDSVVLSLALVARDTLATGLSLQLYRLPPTVDSTSSFPGIDSLLVDTSLVAIIPIPDTLHKGSLRAVLAGTDLDRVALPPGGDSVLAIGARLVSATPSGVRLGSLAGGNSAGFVTYATVDIPDTSAIRQQTIVSTSAFNTFVTESPLVPVDSLLTVGGEPSSRALLRFSFPRAFLDSVKIIRASLELIPAQPILGLPTDPGFIEVRDVLADIGAKSPITADVRFIVTDTLPANTTDTVRLEVTPTVQLWQSTPSRPQAFFVLIRPEAATFTRAQFGSSRAPSIGAPRLRITFQRAFPFQSP